MSGACAKAALQVPFPQRLVSHAQKQILFVKGYFQVRKMSTSQTNSICGDACQATCDAHCHAHLYTMQRSKAVYRRAKQQLAKPARACSWDGSSTAHCKGTAQDVCRETCRVELRHAVVPRTLTDTPAVVGRRRRGPRPRMELKSPRCEPRIQHPMAPSQSVFSS